MNEKMDLYIDDLAENQGVLFTKAVEQGFDLCSFANMYLRSSPRDFMDKCYPYWMTLIPSILIDKLPLSKVQKTAEWQDTWEAEWFGEFYAWYQYLTNLPSVQIAESVSPEFLHAHYNVLHDLDIKLAVKKLAEVRGVSI